MRRSADRVYTPVLLSCLLAAGGCASANKQAWASASSRDTCDAYGDFLAKFPQSEEAAQAHSRQRRKCEQKDWEAASSVSSEASYQAYLQHYPYGLHAAAAHDGLASLTLRTVKRVRIEVIPGNCAESICPFAGSARTALQRAGFTVAEGAEEGDATLRISPTLYRSDWPRELPSVTLYVFISLVAKGATVSSRKFEGKAEGWANVKGDQMTPHWPEIAAVFDAASFESAVEQLMQRSAGRSR